MIGKNTYICSGLNVSNCEEFWISNYPAVSSFSNSKVIIISTPKGKFNVFYDLYTNARTVQEKKEYDDALKSGDEDLIREVTERQGKRNSFVSAKFSYDVVPGRDEKWAKEQIGILGETKFIQEFACEFTGSIQTIINALTLERLDKEWIEPLEIEFDEKLKIYERPEKDFKYILGVDPAKGTGKNSSCIQVLKVISTDPLRLKQVAVFKDNKTDPFIFSRILNRLGIWYNMRFSNDWK